MKWRFLFIGLLLPAFSHASNIISSMTWVESGDYKMAQQDIVPVTGSLGTTTVCSTCVLSRVWDGTNIKLFGAKGELIFWYTYVIASTNDATNVMVTLSSFTGTGLAAGTGFSSVVVSSANAWNYTNRPYVLTKLAYIQDVGKSEVDTYWDNSEYDEQQLPIRMQVPYTVNGSNQGVTNSSALWSSRQTANKFLPDPTVPIEEYASSSFTVSASSSQAIGGELYIATNTIANATYTATETIWEGNNVSTTIPVQLYVYNVTLQSTATLPVVAALGYSEIDVRFYGNRSPANEQVDPYLTGHLRAAAFLHRHKIITVGDPSVQGQYYPGLDYSKHLDGSAFKETYGLSYNSGPGYGVGDKIYWIGLYGQLFSGGGGNVSTTTLVGTNGYCTAISSYNAYCQNNGLNCQEYTHDDEASATILHTVDNTLASYNNTASTCIVNGIVLPYLQTGNLETVNSTAPFINTVMSTEWLNPSTAAYQSIQNSYTNYPSSRAAGGYNSNLGVGTIFPYEDDGLTPRESMWGAYKTNMASWFLWFINYWDDGNNCPQTNNGWNATGSFCDNDNFNIAKSFGYDVFPSTSAPKGHYGFNFTNKDGLMIYPGTDTLKSPSFGFNGVIGSWRLNQMTRGIEDVDIINAAKAVNPVATANLVNQQVQDVMWLRQCFNTSDCSYAYGVRPWNQAYNSWEQTREALLQIAAGANNGSPTPGPATEVWTGTIKATGNIKAQ